MNACWQCLVCVTWISSEMTEESFSGVSETDESESGWVRPLQSWFRWGSPDLNAWLKVLTGEGEEKKEMFILNMIKYENVNIPIHLLFLIESQWNMSSAVVPRQGPKWTPATSQWLIVLNIWLLKKKAGLHIKSQFWTLFPASVVVTVVPAKCASNLLWLNI